MTTPTSRSFLASTSGLAFSAATHAFASEKALNSQENLMPDHLAWDAPPPVLPDADGWYPAAISGTTEPA